MTWLHISPQRCRKWLEEAGIIISAGEISNILTQEKKEELTKEREEILKAGLESSSYFHIDDSGQKHEEKNHHIHVICNEMGLGCTPIFIIISRSVDMIESGCHSLPGSSYKNCE